MIGFDGRVWRSGFDGQICRSDLPRFGDRRMPNAMDMISQIDFDSALRELASDGASLRESHSRKDIHNLEEYDVRFGDFWSLTMDLTASPQPRVEPPLQKQTQVFCKHLNRYRRKDTLKVAQELEVPLILSVDGHFLASSKALECGCNHCETCFHNNVLSLRKLMFPSEK